MAGTLLNIAILHKQRQEFAAGLTLLKQALPHHRVALEANPQNPVYRWFYRSNLFTQANCYAGLADHVRLTATADALARAGWNPVNDNYDAARFFCQGATLADRAAQLPEPRRKELAKSYGDRALSLLRQAVAHGYKDVAYMRQGPDLEPLRAREDFRKLLADLEEKSKE
jgi:hypothetical protein